MKPEMPVLIETELVAQHLRPDKSGKMVEIGRRVIRNKLVTDAGVAYIVDAWQGRTGTVSGESYAWNLQHCRYHDSGTGTNAENVADTALQTPCGEARDTGTVTEGDTANVFKTVATHTYAGAFAITEHGLFSHLTVVPPTDGMAMLDRSIFTGEDKIDVVEFDQIVWTYTLTVTAGG